MNQLHRIALAAFLAGSLAALAGCGDYAPPLTDVTGTLTYDGKPVPGMTISFLPANGRPSWGITDEQGRYRLSWDADHPGAEVGTHRVVIAYVPNTPMSEAGYDDGSVKKKKDATAKSNSLTPEAQALHAKYGAYDTSPLSREVKSGKQVIDLTMKSDEEP